MIALGILFAFGSAIAKRAAAKGRSAAGYVIVLILFWWLGEILSNVVAA